MLPGFEVVRHNADDSLAYLEERLDRDPARQVRTVEGCRAREIRDVARVIHLGVVVGDATDHRVVRERRGGAHDLRFRQVAVMRHAGRAAAGIAEHVVEQHAGADVDALDESFVERVEEAHRLHEVRGDALQQ